MATKVAILGATGQNGSSIVNGLLSASHKFDITALLQGLDILIVCCILNEVPLINAAKKAGVGRYIPCFYASVMPRGVQTLRDNKEASLDHIQRVHLPYTVIDVGWWYQISLPRLPSGRLDRSLFLYNTAIGGNGDVLSARTDSRDVGAYVARIITDPRTLNQKVFAFTDLRTQNDLWDTVARLSGEKLEKKYRTAEEIEQGIAATKENQAKTMDYFQYTYQKSFDLMGENTPEYARYLGYLIAKDLYPDFQGITFEDFVKYTLENGLEPMYEEHQEWIRATSAFVFKGEPTA
ncbi:Isoflavone reductase family protein [Fusarium keratoplasticum]|uniref:Isoflavone reductase family protein n=1 Tax=Fusarium keratoplasticum TaxID=1328300 RepID=A0ACC0QYC1_9HYPO|nr:Isoflavone reductase family protein [Fusarium keratoplasticum]KAI8668667.1 Isoflavone reductase family protein [Fusarium keratoplasticum]